MRWTNEDLFEARGRYEQECVDARMRPNAIHSYWDYARRFLQCRIGEYRPRGAAGPVRRAKFLSVGTADLSDDAKAYALEVEAAGRHQLVRQGRLVSPPDRATQAGVIVRHASVHGQAGERGERTKRPCAPGGRGG